MLPLVYSSCFGVQNIPLLAPVKDEGQVRVGGEGRCGSDRVLRIRCPPLPPPPPSPPKSRSNN